uniref:Nucleoside-triphosphatase, cancer-related n=1 Tax=Sinocyclocheilus rhinocerous TaxID=307959 RepID=A0A673NL92_9TELE
MANDRKTPCLPLLGVGKTTLVKEVCDAVVSAGVAVSGFYTEEVRERGRRVGFDVVTITGDRGRLSRLRYRGRECRVGQYVVDLQSFESLFILNNRDSVSSGMSGRLFVIDEMGKMELFSQAFIRWPRTRVVGSLTRPGRSILGTIPVSKAKPLALVEEVCSRQDVKIFMVKICLYLYKML